jgi:hypothetical protein
MFTVLYVDADENIIYLDRTTYHTFDDSMRIALMGKARCVVDNIRFTRAGTLQAGDNSKGLRVDSYNSPVVRNITGVDLDDDLLQYYSCYAPKTDMLTVASTKTSQTDPSTGYGLVEYSCAFGVHSKLKGSGVRHLYTNGAKGIADEEAATAQPRDFGETDGSLITDSIGSGCGHSAFDTHEESRNMTFANCWALYRHKGPASIGQPGISNRGVNTTFISCGTRGCGFRQNAIANLDIVSTLIGCVIDTVPTRVQDTAPRNGIESIGTSTARSIVKMLGGQVVFHQQAGVSARYSDVYLRNTTIECKRTSVTPSSFFLSNDDSTIELDGVVLDSSGATGAGQVRIATVLDADSIVEVFGGRWRGSQVPSTPQSFNMSDEAGTAKVRDFRADGSIAAPINAANATTVVSIAPNDPS